MIALADRLRRGDTIITAWSGLADPILHSHLLQEDFDAITLDMQHGLLDIATAAMSTAHALAYGKPTIARVPIGDFASAARLLDAGVTAIIAPMINTAADAASFVDHVKFAPAGSRSWGPSVALNHWHMTPGQYLKHANVQCLAIAMIETREAMANLDAILATPHIDGVFFGPSDMSVALTDGEAVDAGASLEPSIRLIAERAHAAGKLACGFAADGKRAAALLAMRYNLVSVGTEVSHLRAGARTMIAQARVAL